MNTEGNLKLTQPQKRFWKLGNGEIVQCNWSGLADWPGAALVYFALASMSERMVVSGDFPRGIAAVSGGGL